MQGSFLLDLQLLVRTSSAGCWSSRARRSVWVDVLFYCDLEYRINRLETVYPNKLDTKFSRHLYTDYIPVFYSIFLL
jgi:hypothetical protein